MRFAGIAGPSAALLPEYPRTSGLASRLDQRVSVPVDVNCGDRARVTVLACRLVCGGTQRQIIHSAGIMFICCFSVYLRTVRRTAAFHSTYAPVDLRFRQDPGGTWDALTATRLWSRLANRVSVELSNRTRSVIQGLARHDRSCRGAWFWPCASTSVCHLHTPSPCVGPPTGGCPSREPG